MTWEFEPDRAIYAQLVDQIKLRVVSGMYEPGGRLPPVRELAVEASVNPNTMQKALAELEQDGLLYSQRTSGRFVTEDTQKIALVRDQLACRQTDEFLRRMRQLGFSREESIRYMEKRTEGEPE